MSEPNDEVPAPHAADGALVARLLAELDALAERLRDEGVSVIYAAAHPEFPHRRSGYFWRGSDMPLAEVNQLHHLQTAALDILDRHARGEPQLLGSVETHRFDLERSLHSPEPARPEPAEVPAPPAEVPDPAQRLVNPEWQVTPDGMHLLFFGSPAGGDLAAQVGKDHFLVWPPGPSPKGTCYVDYRRERSDDECKRACERALRREGYDFLPLPIVPGTLTADERAVLGHLVDAWEAYRGLPQPRDGSTFAGSIHRLQDLVALRAARRANPDVFA